MTEPSTSELEQRRAELYAQLAATGDFRRGSVNETYRRCGKPGCRCAQPDHPGHGPRFLWTRSVDGKTQSRQLAEGAELDKVRRELARHKEFVAVSERIVEVNEAICEARPILPLADRATPSPEGEKRGSRGSSARHSRRPSPPS